MMNIRTWQGGYGMTGTPDGMGSGFGFLPLLFAIVVLIDLILLGIWLWKQINKK
jgi:uncharacterized membrane protein